MTETNKLTNQPTNQPNNQLNTRAFLEKFIVAQHVKSLPQTVYTLLGHS